MLLIEKDWNYIKESVSRGVPVTEDELGTEWAGYELIQVSSIKRCNYDDQFIYCFQMDDQEDPYFTLANGIITHNCRLLSDTSKLDAFINSIGGTALSIGSVKVNTINLMRIALETRGMENREEKYLEILRERAILCCQTLDIIRHIIQRNIEKGLLPNFCRGGVEMSKLYNTIGILATYEAVKDFGYIVKDSFDDGIEDGFCGVKYTDEGIAFASKIFEVLNDVKDNFTDEYSINIESVPRMSGHEAA
jgi:anaerobic ribonucleoside-triphosphate reductase